MFQISLCDEYSLPLDHVNKRRPNSAASAPVDSVNWTTESPVKSDKVNIALSNNFVPRRHHANIQFLLLGSFG